MKRKYMISAAACIFILIAGICYSCAYEKDPSYSAYLDLTQGQKEVPTGIELQEKAASSSEAENKKKFEDLRNATAPSVETEATEAELKTESTETEKEELSHVAWYVHICGAVKNPGVYQVKEAARVVDVIEQAGGLTSEAAGDYVNQAMQLQDGQRIYIPTDKEVAELPAGTELTGSGIEEKAVAFTSEPEKAKLININTATIEELMELPGVGEAKAVSIIDYRDTNGSFQTIEELMKISGIKEGLFHKVSKLITVK